MTKRRNKREPLCAVCGADALLTGCSGQYGGIAASARTVWRTPTPRISCRKARIPPMAARLRNALFPLSFRRSPGGRGAGNSPSRRKIRLKNWLQALIDGPQDTQYQFNALISPDTELVSVKEQSGYLSVTLSENFSKR